MRDRHFFRKFNAIESGILYPENTHYRGQVSMYGIVSNLVTGLVESSQTGGKLYSDLSLYKVCECSLLYHIK